jgi:hypothetical protein
MPWTTTDRVRWRREVRLLATLLASLWAGLAVAIVVAYRPGGPLDAAVVLAGLLPVLVAAVGVAWPASPGAPRDRLALGWLWLAAVLFAIPLLYSVLATLAQGGPQRLVPSGEFAYGALVALCLMALFSLAGPVHAQRGTTVFERGSSIRSLLAAVAAALAIALVFGALVGLNDAALRSAEPPRSRFGPTDPAIDPPLCDVPIAIGEFATVTLTASASIDGQALAEARLDGRRSRLDEAWSASWSVPADVRSTAGLAYRRVANAAWLNEGGSDVDAPGIAWRPVPIGSFDLAGADGLTLDGPTGALLSGPPGSLVVEDLGIEIVEGARARHCRTFVDGPSALATFLPLRWLVSGRIDDPRQALVAWRGELDWWVFSDGELGRASVEVSGNRSDAWAALEGVRGSLSAVLEAVDRSQPTDVVAPRAANRATAPADRGNTPPASPGSAPAPSPGSAPAPSPGSAPAPSPGSALPGALQSAAP